MDYRIVSIAKRTLVSILHSNGIRFSETIDTINLRCPHCGDSRQSRGKKRGFFVFKNSETTGWMFYYKCQNGGCEFNQAIGIQRYLKRFHPKAYDDFKSELAGSKNPMNSANFSDFNWKKMEEEQRAKAEEELKEKLKYEMEQTQYFIPLTATPDSAIERHYVEKAIAYCKTRRLPKHIYDKFFVAIDGKYQDRIVVPFFRKSGKPSYFQGRSIDGQEPKYLNRYGKKQFYNIEFVDWTRPVVVTEGAFDSMFFDNSFALNGISSSGEEFKSIVKDHGESLYFLLDNDSAGATQSHQLLTSGLKVFLWRKFVADYPVLNEYMNNLRSEGLKVKLDWNDVVKLVGVNQWNTDDVAKYFSRNPLDVPYIRGYRNG